MSGNGNDDFTGNPLFIAMVKGIAALGIVAVAVGAFNMLLLQPTLARDVERKQSAECRHNLSAFYDAFVKYSHGHNGALVPLTPHMEFFGTFPGMDMLSYRCPAAGSSYEHLGRHIFVMESDYIYLGYAVRDQEELDLLAQQYIEHVTQSGESPALETLGTPEYPLQPLRIDLEDAARIPLLVEAYDYHGGSNPHEHGGGHILYLDGHIEYLRMDEKFPLTWEFFDVVWSMKYPSR